MVVFATWYGILFSISTYQTNIHLNHLELENYRTIGLNTYNIHAHPQTHTQPLEKRKLCD